MPIEISNNTISGYHAEPGKESKTGEAQIGATKAAQDSGAGITSLTAKENAFTCDVTDTARMMQMIDTAISQIPVVDSSRIAQIKSKMQSGNFDAIKKNTTAQLASAERIAQKILDIEFALPIASPTPGDKKS